MNIFTFASILAATLLFLGSGTLQARSQSPNNANAAHQHHHAQQARASQHHHQLQNNARAAQHHLKSAAQSQLHRNQLEQESKKQSLLKAKKPGSASVKKSARK